MSLFFVDSNCELSDDEIKKLGIEKIDLPYLYEGEKKTFDGDYNKLYSKIRKGNEVNKYIPTEQEYIDYFTPALKMGDDVIYATSSSEIYDNINLLEARDMLLEVYPDRRICILDTGNFSIGQGIISYMLALKYRNGATLEELEQYLIDIKKEYLTQIVVDDLYGFDGLHGFNNGVTFGGVLGVKPLVSVSGLGTLVVTDKLIGRNKAKAKLISNIRQMGENIADNIVGIVYGRNEKEAMNLCDTIRETFGSDVRVIMSRVSPNNLSILGHSPLGISYHVHRNHI